MTDAPLILIVDDSLLLQQIAVRLLSQAGYRTCTADDGQSALRLARLEKPDLILLDVMLPDISGLEVCRQLKADPALTGCFVVMLSSVRIDSPSQVEGLEGGADGYIARPIPNDELLARVRGLLRIKHAEDRLRESEERLREVLENSLDASYKRDLQTNTYDYLSPVFARLSGYTPDEMMTLPIETVLNLMHPDDRAEVGRVVAESMSGAAGTAYQVDYRFKHKAGQYRWLQDRFTVMQDAAGRPAALIGSVSDITERKQIEQALQQSEANLRTIFENSLQSFMLFDRDRRVQALNRIANERARAIYGREIQPGDSIYDYMQPRARADFDQNFERVLAGESIQLEQSFSAGGREQWFEYHIAPVRADGGRVTGVFLSTTDITERKQASEALRASEEKFRAIVEQSTEGIMLVDEQGYIIEWNRAHEQITGIMRAEALGRPLWDIQLRQTPTAQRAQVTADFFKQIMISVLATGQSPYFNRPIETLFETASGELKTILQNTFPIKTDKGYRLGSIIRDITERKRAEEELQFRNVLLSTQQEASIDGILVVDEKARIVSFNRRFVEMWGLPAKIVEDRVDEPVLQFVTAQLADPRSFLQRVQYLYEHRRETGREELILADGRIIDRFSAPMFGPEEQYYGRVWYFRDITDRKRAEEALQESEARYRTLIENVGEGIGLVNPEDQFTFANPAAEGIFGVPPGGLLGRSLREFTTLEWFGVIRDQTRLRRVGEKSAYEVEIGHPDGEKRGLLVTAVPQFDSQGKFAGTFGVFRDITDRKRAETALRELNATLEQRVADRTRRLAEANAQLSELDRLKDDFISRISHELRTPLTSIKIYLEMLDTVKPEKRARYMQVLTEQTNRLQHLIEGLLEVTQQSVNAAGVHVAPTDLNHLAASLAADMAPRAAERGLTLTTALTPELPFAAADALSLAQVLSKLAANALNYTPAGGTIDLSTAEVIDAGETWITFTIRDTGPGVAPDEQAHIFDRFYRGRAAADYKVPGAGIGLAVSRDLITLMAGRLTVQSDGVPGAQRGAAFTAWLKPA